MKKVKSVSSLHFSIVAVVMAFCMAFSTIAFSQKGTFDSSQASASTENLNLSSFTDKTQYSLTSSTQDFTVKPYSLTDLVDAKELENTDTTKNVQSALTTKDLIWLPSQSEITTMTSVLPPLESDAGKNAATLQTSKRSASSSNFDVYTGSFAPTNFTSRYDNTNSVGYFLRSPASASAIYDVHYGGNINAFNPGYAYSMRPALQFNLNAILSAKEDLNIQIDVTNRTIIVPNIMFPQKRVTAGSTLESDLESAYNGGSLQNGMTATGVVFAGYSGKSLTNGTFYARQFSEFIYKDGFYARYTKNENGSNITSGYAWFRVEPIVWYITNWDNMPTSINPNSSVTTPDSEIVALSQYVLNRIHPYPNNTDTGCTLWQNSPYRAYLNGYDLAEQNNGTNGSNDSAYLAPIQANFKGNGFAQTVWHDLKPSLISKATLTNNGYDSSNNALDSSTLNTTDSVWLPSGTSGTTDPTSINTMITNVLGNVGWEGRVSVPTEFAVYNGSHIYAGRGTTLDIIRSPLSNSSYYQLFWGGPNGGNMTYTAASARPAMVLNLNNLFSFLGGDNNIQINEDEKIIVLSNFRYPQTKVIASSNLERNLESSYNGGNLKGDMLKTNKVFYGVTKYNADNTQASRQFEEFLYQGEYYARYVKAQDGTDITTTGYAWFKVEPIEWYISNWAYMPTSVNPSGDGSASEMIVFSKYSLSNISSYYPNTTDDYRSMWQNSNYRAYLNGYDLWDENTYGNGNTNYKAATQTSFKGQGFVDTIWHESTQALLTPTTLQNNGFESDGTAINTATNNLMTTDLVWLPSYDSSTSTPTDPTDIRNLLSEISDKSSITKSTDFTISNFSIGFPNSILRLRTATSSSNNVHLSYQYDSYGGGGASTDRWAYGIGLSFDINAIVSGYKKHNIQIDADNKTIMVSNIMYPQTKILEGTSLYNKLLNAFNNGNLRDGMVETGKVYIGARYNPVEYCYKGNYYVRMKVYKYATNYTFSDGSSIANNEFIWIKVEPIKWYITNWSKMPEIINPTGDGTADSIMALSRYSIVNIGSFGSDSFWQNSRIRAYLNGYDLSEQNTGLNGNASYKSSTNYNFKGNGFIDTIWHDLSEVSLVDILGKTTLNNTVYNASDVSTNDATTKTSDYVYVPTKAELEGYYSTRQDRIITPTDYALANKANLNTKYNSTYNFDQGSTQYWLRGATSSNMLEYVDYLGNYAMAQNKHSHFASVLALNFDSNALISAKGKINFEIDSTKKTITLSNLMYPQTKVEKGSQLETDLNSAYSSPTSTNSLAFTGNYYAGLTTFDGDNNQNTQLNKEYLYKGNYYVRTLVTKYNASYVFSDGDDTTVSGEYIWVKVEPVVWVITNWNDLPSELTDGQTSGSATTLSAISQYALVCVGDYYPNTTDAYRTAWQNSVLRAFLNGFDLDEQINDLSNGSATFKAPILCNFKGFGFVDSCWHAYLPNNN